MNTVCPFKYLDCSQYLTDVYNDRKKIKKSFSYSIWANECGFKSRSFLRLVVTGKRSLTVKSGKAILKTLNLNIKQSKYFMLLVAYKLANKIEDKQQILLELRGLSKKENAKIYSSLEYLADHWTPRVHVLLGLDGIDKSVESLSKMTKLPVDKIKKILTTLESMNRAKRMPSEQWVSLDSIFEVPEDINNVAIQSFHKNSLEAALDKIGLDSSKREFQSIFFALNEDEYKYAVNELNLFTDQLLKKLSSSKAINKKLFQLNTNLIPMTDVLIQKETFEAEPLPVIEQL